MAPKKNPPSKARTLTRRHLIGISIGTISVGTTVWTLWRYRQNTPLNLPEAFAKLPRLNSPKPTPIPPTPSSPSPRPSPAPPSSRPPAIILPHEKNYATFLNKLHLRYISPQEILTAHRRQRNGIANILPPRKYWNGMIPTLQMADELRHRLGVKLRYITSAYRSPEYNAQCPGASPRSYHTKNIALDLVYDCPPKTAIAEAKKMREEGLFLGGLGLYKTFIHLDTRGRNADWG